MKHIEKRFLNEFSETEFNEIMKQQEFTVFEKGIDSNTLNSVKQLNQRQLVLKTANNKYLKGFPHKVNGQVYAFPEPDPTIIYFSIAQSFKNSIEKHKDALLPKLNLSSNSIGEMTHDFYNYYGAVCGTVIFLFTSIESFMNSLIVDTDIYKRVLTNKTEYFDFKQIQENLPFNEKIKDVIPQLKLKDFVKTYPLKFQIISNLKEFRDNIVHTKSKTESMHQDYIIKKSLFFNYNDTIDTVSEYMNFYKLDYIKECNCGKDF